MELLPGAAFWGLAGLLPSLAVKHGCDRVQGRSGLLRDPAVMCDGSARVSPLTLAGYR